MIFCEHETAYIVSRKRHFFFETPRRSYYGTPEMIQAPFEKVPTFVVSPNRKEEKKLTIRKKYKECSWKLS